MEFLVNIEVGWPADGDPDELARITAAERIRGAELAAAGTIRRMWRVPGRRANWGVWEAEDATALHAAIALAARSSRTWRSRSSRWPRIPPIRSDPDGR